MFIPIDERMVNEEWRTIPEFPAYAVSEYGRAMRLRDKCNGKAGHILRANQKRDGYLRYTLVRADGVPREVPAHRLVCRAFLGPYPDGHETNHKDGVKWNNHVSNLEYVTKSENTHHAHLLGLKPTGEQSTSARLTESQVRCIRALGAAGVTGARLGRLFLIKKSQLCRILRRRSWRFAY